MSQGGRAPGDPLDGRAFVASSAVGRELAPDVELVLRFVDGAVVAHGGCNTQRGDYTLEDLAPDGSTGGSTARLVVGPMMSTMMACAEELMAQDQWIAELLADGPAMVAVDEKLTLRGGGVELAMLEVLARD